MLSGRSTRGGHSVQAVNQTGCEQALRLRVLPYFEPAISTSRSFKSAFADHMIEQNADWQTIRNTLLPLKATCRRAKQRGQLAVNPMKDLNCPLASTIRFAFTAR